MQPVATLERDQTCVLSLSDIARAIHPKSRHHVSSEAVSSFDRQQSAAPHTGHEAIGCGEADGRCRIIHDSTKSSPSLHSHSPDCHVHPVLIDIRVSLSGRHGCCLTIMMSSSGRTSLLWAVAAGQGAGRSLAAKSPLISRPPEDSIADEQECVLNRMKDPAFGE